MKRWIIKILAGVTIFMGLTSCGNYFFCVSDRNFAHLYDPVQVEIHPITKLYRISKDSSLLMVRIPVSEISFPEIKRRREKTSGITVEYYLLDSAQADMWRDSAIFNFKLSQKPATNYFQIEIAIPLQPNNSTLIEVRIKDMISGGEGNNIVRILPDSRQNPQRYKAFYNNADYPYFRHFASEGDSVQFCSSNYTDSLWMFHLTYNTKDSLPFDTAFKIAQNKFVKFKWSGSYIINSDSSLVGGLRYVVSNPFFPSIRQAKQMIAPIRYLTEPEEWKMLSKLSPKQAVDTFWLVAAPNSNQAKQLIQVFYNRVQLANIKFSNHQEGWKTEMGKMLIVSGLPDEVEITNKGENWYYYFRKKEKLIVPYEFNLEKVDFETTRKDSLITKFIIYNINNWRNGKF